MELKIQILRPEPIESAAGFHSKYVMLNARDLLKGILDNFMLPVVSQDDSYEQFHFMQDGTPEHTALPILLGLITILLVGGLGVEEQQNGFREVSVSVLMTYFCGVAPKGK
jgi:hypothetical protein